MRILHIWDQAGVACIFAKYQRLQGHESKVIIIGDQDKYGIIKFYKDYVVGVSEREFFEKCIEEASQADIIHIHSLINVLFKLRKIFGRSKKIIFQYHGTDIRKLYVRYSRLEDVQLEEPYELSPPRASLLNIMVKRITTRIRGKPMPKRLIHVYAQMLADAVLVAAPELLRFVEKGIYVPIPVDTAHYRPNKISEDERKDALTIKTEITDIKRVIDYCEKNNIKLDIEVYDRTNGPIMYGDMPEFLKGYRVYVDIRFIGRTMLEHLSSTALQSLACGLQVLDYDLKFRQGLPPQHAPANIVSNLSNIYSKKRSNRLFWYFLLLIRGS
jgi:hypothetical protein